LVAYALLNRASSWGANRHDTRVFASCSPRHLLFGLRHPGVSSARRCTTCGRRAARPSWKLDSC
jgi:hypothetical protein